MEQQTREALAGQPITTNIFPFQVRLLSEGKISILLGKTILCFTAPADAVTPSPVACQCNFAAWNPHEQPPMGDSICIGLAESGFRNLESGLYIKIASVVAAYQ